MLKPVRACVAFMCDAVTAERPFGDAVARRVSQPVRETIGLLSDGLTPAWLLRDAVLMTRPRLPAFRAGSELPARGAAYCAGRGVATRQREDWT